MFFHLYPLNEILTFQTYLLSSKLLTCIQVIIFRRIIFYHLVKWWDRCKINIYFEVGLYFTMQTSNMVNTNFLMSNFNSVIKNKLLTKNHLCSIIWIFNIILIIFESLLFTYKNHAEFERTKNWLVRKFQIEHEKFIEA